jgi:hypothetical protein
MTTANKQRTTFSLAYDVSVEIDAAPEVVWALLTDASRIPEWNSAVSAIYGQIAEGETLAVKVPFSDRTFKLKVSDVQAPRRMMWSDGFAPMFRGARTYEVTPTERGCRFVMREEFSGVMLPMIAGSLPDFTASFEAWANDLRAAAEA